MEAQELVIYGVAGFVANIFGGIAGGGAGFVMTPLAIFLGLTPAQAVANGKFGGLAVTLTSLQRLERERLHSWRMVIPIMALAGVIGLAAPIVITKMESDVYRNVLGVLLLVMIPVVLLKKVGLVKRKASPKQQVLGWILLSITLAIQAVFSGGMGMLVNLVLMGMMGMSALEATVTKRFSQVLLNSLIIFGVIGSGLAIWQVALTSAIAAGAGGAIGSRLAIKRGNRFVSYIFVVFMLLAAIELLIGQ